MRIVLSAASFASPASLDDIRRQAAQAGYQHVELTCSPADEISIPIFDAPAGPSATNDVGREGAALFSVRLKCDVIQDIRQPDSLQRRAALECVRTVLNESARIGAELLVLEQPAPQPGGNALGAVRPDDGLGALQTALLELRFAAEYAGVPIAIGVGHTRGPLADPIVCREFLDALATPWVGADVGFAGGGATGAEREWLLTLGSRIRSVRFSVTAGDAIEPGPPSSSESSTPQRLARALADARFGGAVVITADGDPAAALQAIRRWFDDGAQPDDTRIS
ncbi:MAG: hypothetical protein V3T70_01790 [Phycisphaerae bacterium]